MTALGLGVLKKNISLLTASFRISESERYSVCTKKKAESYETLFVTLYGEHIGLRLASIVSLWKFNQYENT